MPAGEEVLSNELTQASRQRDPASPSDEVLVKRFHTRRDPELFRMLVDRYQHFAFRVATCVCSNASLAEEAVQDAFIQVARPDCGFTSEGEGSFRAWFYGVVINVAKTHSRTEQRIKRRAQSRRFQEEVAVETEIRAGAMAMNGESPMNKDTLMGLRQALDLLGQELRLPIVLHFLNGQSQTDVGRLMGISGSQVSRRISKGLDLLRDRMVKSGHAISLAGLTELLKQPDHLSAPESLQLALRQLDISALHDAPNAVIITRGIAGKYSKLLWVTATFVFGGLAYGITHFIPVTGQSPEVEKSSAPAAPVSGPFLKRWAFEKGIDREFEVVQGDAFWQEAQGDRPSAMVLPSRADGSPAVLLPGKAPLEGAFVVTAICRPHEVTDFQFGITWSDGTWHLGPRRYWKFDSDLLSIDKRYEFNVYFHGRFVVSQFAGRSLPMRVLEYERPRPADRVVISCENWEFESIEWRSVKESELPEFVRDIERTIKSYKEAPKKGKNTYKFSGRDRPETELEDAFKRAVVFHRKWTFENGVPPELKKIPGGDLHWLPAKGKRRARIKVGNQQVRGGTLIQFPEDIPIAPLVVRVIGYWYHHPTLEVSWIHQQSSVRRQSYVNLLKGYPGQRIEHRSYLFGKYSLAATDNELSKVLVYERPWPAKHLALVIRNYEIEEIEIMGLKSLADLPVSARAPKQALQTMRTPADIFPSRQFSVLPE